MSTRVSYAMLVVVGAMSSSAFAAGRVFMIPAGQDPSDFPSGPATVQVCPGETVAIEYFLQDVSEDVRAYQTSVPCSAAGGDFGSVGFVPGTGAVDIERTDWIFFGAGEAVQAVDKTCNPGVRHVGSLFAGAVAVTQPPKYLGQVSLVASTEASGAFTFGFINVPGSETALLNEAAMEIPLTAMDGLVIVVETADEIPGPTCDDGMDNDCDGFVDCDDDGCADDPVCLSCADDSECQDEDVCTLDQCVEGDCVHSPRVAADVNQDGIVNIFDLLCVLEGFAGNDNCSTCP